jgi:hypothetical protein
MAAEGLAAGGCRVTVIDHMASPARKFLMAGRGGLNITHSEPLDTFLSRYGPARAFLEPAIRAFPPQAVRTWCEGLGVETFVGSSGRVFPRSMKASPLLRAWLRRLQELGVAFQMRTRWPGPDSTLTLLAMGGASWPKLGSDAAWVPVLEKAGVAVHPFRPANAGIVIPWTEHFKARFAGTPLKRIAVTSGHKRISGEAMVTSYGLEGGVIYALSPELRESSSLSIDLRPDLSLEQLVSRLRKPRGKESKANWLRKAAGLPPVAIALLREAEAEPTADIIKCLPLSAAGSAGLMRAISSAGGIAREEVDHDFQLRKIPGVYAVGEMLDWEAPTGGYLLQACFSTAVKAARSILENSKNS